MTSSPDSTRLRMAAKKSASRSRMVSTMAATVARTWRSVALQPAGRADQIEQVADEAELGRAIAARRLDADPEALELGRARDGARAQLVGQVDVRHHHQQRAHRRIVAGAWTWG
jgi:hypothetical protein